MSGENELRPSSWTVDTLHAHLTQRLDDLTAMLDERYATQVKALDAAFNAAERAVQAALLSAEKAVTKAETAQEKRLESVNEFRAQLTDQAATFVRRDEIDVRVGSINDKIDALTNRVDLSQGAHAGADANRNQIAQLAGLALVVVSVAVAIIVAVVK